jgi:ADP-ribosylglycohydrolase
MVLPPRKLMELLPKPWQEHDEFEKTLFKVFVSYAAGDAFGAFYEFTGKPHSVPNLLKAKENWPYGGISDDTMLTILTLISLKETSPELASKRFINLLRANINNLRGLGPTTRKALGLDVKEHESSSIGITNGGMMRTCLVAFLFPEKQERDNWLRELVSATHTGEEAISFTLKLGDLVHAKDSLTFEPIHSTFPNGVSNTSIETFSAIKMILATSQNLEEVIRNACTLGGDTDTTAAISSAIYAFWHPGSDEVFSLSWISEVNWSELKQAPDALHELYRRAKR